MTKPPDSDEFDHIDHCLGNDDGLRHGGVIEDDKFSNIGIPIYKWEKAAKNKGKIKVLVEEA